MTRDPVTKRFIFNGLLFVVSFLLASAPTPAKAIDSPKETPVKIKKSATKKPTTTGDTTNQPSLFANVDGQPITREYVETILQNQSPLFRRTLDEKEKKIEFFDRLINMTLLAKEAQKRGFSTHKEVASVSKNQLASLMHRKIAEGIADVAPTTEDLQTYYDAHLDRYRKPEKIRARHILIKDKKKAKSLLVEIIKKKVSQHEFRKLAQDNSQDESTRQRGGDLSFFTRPAHQKENDPKIDAAIIDAVFKLDKNGAVAPKLIKTPAGFHIVMRTGYRKKMDLSFDDAKDRLVTLVKREQRKDRVAAAINALKKQFPTTISEENLKHVVIDLSLEPSEPSTQGGPNQRDRRPRKKKRTAAGTKAGSVAP